MNPANGDKATAVSEVDSCQVCGPPLSGNIIGPQALLSVLDFHKDAMFVSKQSHPKFAMNSKHLEVLSLI